MDCNRAQNSRQYLMPIAMLAVAIQIFSDITAGMLVSVFGQTVSVTIFYFPLTFVISDILTEVYGYSQARRVVNLVLWCSVACALLSLIVLFAPQTPQTSDSEAYVRVFSFVPRVVIAGWIATWCGEMSNNYIMAMMREHSKDQHFCWRALLSTMVGQFVNTSMFYFLGLGGQIPWGILVGSVASAWGLKVGIELICLPVTSFLVQWLQSQEGSSPTPVNDLAGRIYRM